MDEDKRIQYGSASGHLKEHISWSHMVNRCLNKNNDNYDYYGGRGVTVCDRWLGENGFANFLNDMGNRPEGGSIERINPNGNYEPTRRLIVGIEKILVEYAGYRFTLIKTVR